MSYCMRLFRKWLFFVDVNAFTSIDLCMQERYYDQEKTGLIQSVGFYIPCFSLGLSHIISVFCMIAVEENTESRSVTSGASLNI